MMVQGLSLEICLKQVRSSEKMKGQDEIHEDPIASDPHLLYVWTRYVGILIAILAFSVGFGEVDLDF